MVWRENQRGGGGVLIGFSYIEIRFLNKNIVKYLKVNAIFCFVPRRNETVLYLVSNIVEQVIQSFASILAETSITFWIIQWDDHSWYKKFFEGVAYKLLNVFISICSKQRYLLAIYTTENFIQLDFNINIAPSKATASDSVV